MLHVNAVIDVLQSLSWKALDRFRKEYSAFELKEWQSHDYVDPTDSLNKFFAGEFGEEVWVEIQDYLDKVTDCTTTPTWYLEYIATQYVKKLFPKESNVLKLFAIYDKPESKTKFNFLELYQDALNKVLHRKGLELVHDTDSYISLNFDRYSIEQIVNIIKTAPGIVVINYHPPKHTSSNLYPINLDAITYVQSFNDFLDKLLMINPLSIRARAVVLVGEDGRLPEKTAFVTTAVFSPTRGPVEILREISNDQWMENMSGFDEESVKYRDYLIVGEAGTKHEPK